MSSPKVLVQILITGSRILGKAFLEAGRQAVKNAKQTPQGSLGNDAAGVGHANSGSVTDQLTRQHHMTLDEAHLILNLKRGDAIEQVTKHYEHLFKANSPPVPPVASKPQPATSRTGKLVLPSHSHYLQSKVVRARERIEAELKVGEVPPAAASPTPASMHSTQPRPETRAANGDSAS